MSSPADISTLPQTLGAMLLPHVSLFPGSLLPLHIFEHRYRAMLTQALATDRMFAIASHEGEENDLFAIGGAGVVRACVENEDGTSNLILQGLERVRFSSWVQIEPFPIARIEVLESTCAAPAAVARLATEIRELCGLLCTGTSGLPAHLRNYLCRIDDPRQLTDVIASTLVADAGLRQALLEELRVDLRLEMVLEHLRRQLKDGG